MTKRKNIILTLLFFSLAITPSGVSAEEFQPTNSKREETSPSVVSKAEPDERHAKNELRWRQQLEAAMAQRVGLLIAGVGGAVAGTVVLVNGYSEYNDAESTPGCYKSGNEILCDNEEHKNTAQDKLDSGSAKMGIGLAVVAVGAGLGIWGISRGNEVERLENLGKKKGYKLDVKTQGRDGMAVVLSRSF